MKSMKQDVCIAGIDEAGRGALAGPVVAAACILPGEKKLHPLIRDSKQLTPPERQEAYAWICSHCQYGIGSSLASFIDSDGILAATEKAMQDAVTALATVVTPTYLLIDGRDKFWFDYPHSSIIRGDESEPCISAASILAKVTRDRMMEEYAAKFPAYGFGTHKGYGTAQHFLALRQHGQCTLHRCTFLRKSLLAGSPA